MKSRPECMNSSAGAEDFALNPSLLFRQIGRVYKVNPLLIEKFLSSSMIVVFGGSKVKLWWLKAASNEDPELWS